jgi:hypothetical protein
MGVSEAGGIETDGGANAHLGAGNALVSAAQRDEAHSTICSAVIGSDVTRTP